MHNMQYAEYANKYANKYAQYASNIAGFDDIALYCMQYAKYAKKICTICKICKRHFQYAEYAPPTLLMMIACFDGPTVTDSETIGFFGSPNHSGPAGIRASPGSTAAHRDRRERIATAVLAGFMSSDAEFPRDRPPNFVGVAVALADALIAELDKEVKP